MLSVAVIWHLHQPPYLDPETGRIRLPWVRLHALKDYLRMVRLAARHPGVKLHFNLTPCLIEQLQGLATSEPADELYRVARKDPAELEPEEQQTLFHFAACAKLGTMVASHPRFCELRQRLHEPTPERLTTPGLRDLQVWSNLAWTIPGLPDSGSDKAGTQDLFQSLAAKDWGFTERDKQALFQAQQELLSQVLVEFRRVAEQGSVELLTSPYYHPIGPLICNLASASQANPACDLAGVGFAHPEHLRRQLQAGIERFQSALGSAPRGVWLPEMGLSDEALEVLAQCGVSWTIGNQDLLTRTLADAPQPGPAHCQVYECRGVKLVFRDRLLSDRIGFVYSSWQGAAAAWDLIGHIRNLERQIPRGQQALLVIALDGENPWECYPNQGSEFLETFYSLLETERIRTVLISEYLAAGAAGDAHRVEASGIRSVAPGSWIDSDFQVWAGSPAHRAAWQALARAADAVGDNPEALPHLLAAECSDWFWWLSDRHWNPDARTFEELFRANLRQAYQKAGARGEGGIPPELLRPIRA